jgi:hypothetical protein
MVQKDAGIIIQRIEVADPCFIQKEGSNRDKQGSPSEMGNASGKPAFIKEIHCRFQILMILFYYGIRLRKIYLGRRNKNDT